MLLFFSLGETSCSFHGQHMPQPFWTFGHAFSRREIESVRGVAAFRVTLLSRHPALSGSPRWGGDFQDQEIFSPLLRCFFFQVVSKERRGYW